MAIDMKNASIWWRHPAGVKPLHSFVPLFAETKTDFLTISFLTLENVLRNVAAIWLRFSVLTPKHRETHECVVSTVATEALKHQAISIHIAD